MFSRNGERAHLRDQSGTALAFVALLLFAFLGVAALAVDLGMLMAARTEAQRVADASALAGAGVLSGAPDDEERARSTAKQFAALNNIRSVAADVRDEDVDVDLANWLVRVRALRIGERGNAMTNLFARAIGIDTSDVSAVAAAQWSPTGGANCPLPLVLPDRWWEGVAPGLGDSQTGPWPTIDDGYDPVADDVYRPLLVFNEDGDIIEGPNEPHSSYNEYARGTQIRIKSGDPHDTWRPGTYFPIRFPGMSPGGDAYRERIRSCSDTETIWYPGQWVDQEPGNMIGPTKQGFNDLIALAPNHEWRSSGPGVPAGGCVWDPDRSGGAGCISAFDSPRSRVMPMIDPREVPANPSAPFRLTSFVGVFVESRVGKEIFVRFVEYRGAEALPPGNDDVPVLGRMLQLVQ